MNPKAEHLIDQVYYFRTIIRILRFYFIICRTSNIWPQFQRDSSKTYTKSLCLDSGCDVFNSNCHICICFENQFDSTPFSYMLIFLLRVFLHLHATIMTFCCYFILLQNLRCQLFHQFLRTSFMVIAMMTTKNLLPWQTVYI